MTLVFVSPQSRKPRRPKPFNQCGLGVMLVESAGARQHHHAGCVWKPGKDHPITGERGFRGWLCDPRCEIPQLGACLYEDGDGEPTFVPRKGDVPLPV